LPEAQRRQPQQGIDLDHHLMPDPVGRAVATLLSRIDDLEAELVMLKRDNANRNQALVEAEFSGVRNRNSNIH
jgi:serine O-acetyltransferase